MVGPTAFVKDGTFPDADARTRKRKIYSSGCMSYGDTISDWWVVYQFANPENYPKYWDRSKLPPLPESDSEESEPLSSESESFSDSSYERATLTRLKLLRN